jgi:hypothetical protein
MQGLPDLILLLLGVTFQKGMVKAEDHSFIKKSIRYYVGLLTGALAKGGHFLAFCYCVHAFCV